MSRFITKIISFFHPDPIAMLINSSREKSPALPCNSSNMRQESKNEACSGGIKLAENTSTSINLKQESKCEAHSGVSNSDERNRTKNSYAHHKDSYTSESIDLQNLHKFDNSDHEFEIPIFAKNMKSSLLDSDDEQQDQKFFYFTPNEISFNESSSSSSSTSNYIDEGEGNKAMKMNPKVAKDFEQNYKIKVNCALYISFVLLYIERYYEDGKIQNIDEICNALKTFWQYLRNPVFLVFFTSSVIFATNGFKNLTATGNEEYRGRGILQITSKENFGFLGYQYLMNPDLLSTLSFKSVCASMNFWIYQISYAKRRNTIFIQNFENLAEIYTPIACNSVENVKCGYPNFKNVYEHFTNNFNSFI